MFRSVEGKCKPLTRSRTLIRTRPTRACTRVLVHWIVIISGAAISTSTWMLGQRISYWILKCERLTITGKFDGVVFQGTLYEARFFLNPLRAFLLLHRHPRNAFSETVFVLLHWCSFAAETHSLSDFKWRFLDPFLLGMLYWGSLFIYTGICYLLIFHLNHFRNLSSVHIIDSQN